MSNSNKDNNSFLSSIIMLVIFAIVLYFVFSEFASMLNKQNTLERNIRRDGTSELGLEYKVITLKDGRQLECVDYHGSEVRALSCNWNNPVNQKNTKLNQQ